MEFQNNCPGRAFQPKISQNYKSALILITILAMASVGLAQSTANVPYGSTLVSSGILTIKDSNAAAAVAFPYVAEITGNDVYTRSGAGTNYYSCGKLFKGDRIEVVSTQFGGWSRIVPPAGSFSWISMQYISVSLNDPTIGTITGDDARVYAGSEEVAPMHSTSEQIKLSRGQTVKLLGEGKDDYYKIAPPSGAYLWVSTQYTQPAKPIATETRHPLGTSNISSYDSNAPLADANTAAPPTISIEAEKLKEFYSLREKIKTELAKPIDQHNYEEIKKALKNIADNKEAGKAARYATFVIKQIEGFELAIQVSKEVQLQKTQLQKVMDGIDQARVTKLAKVEDLGRFVVTGKLQTFQTYGPGHYRIVAPDIDTGSDKMICYALPTGQASETDLSKFIGRKVGLVGTIEPHSATGGALVQFTEIVELK